MNPDAIALENAPDGDFSERTFQVISTTYNVLKDRPNTFNMAPLSYFPRPLQLLNLNDPIRVAQGQ
jgi:hypothetical protein